MDATKLATQDAGLRQSAILASTVLGPRTIPAATERHGSLLLETWHVVLKHRWVIVATAIIVTVLTALYTFHLTPLYEAVGRIAINRESGDVLGFKEAGDAAAAANEDWDYNVVLDTQVRILQSDSLALQVAHDLQLDQKTYFAGKRASEPRRNAATSAPLDPKQESILLRNFRNSLQVTKVPRTRVVEIRFLGPDAQLSAQVVNQLINDYIEQNFRTKYESTMQTSNWLSKQLIDLQLKVETSQEDLVKYQKENEILGIDEKQNITTAKLNELNQQLTNAEADRIHKLALYELSKTSNAESLPGVSDNPVVQRLKEQQADLKTEYAQATTRFGSSFPKVQELKNQIAQVESALQAELGKGVERVRSEYLGSLARERMLGRALEKQKQEANRLNERAIQYNILKRDVETNRRLYDGLLQKMKEAGISAGLRSGNIRVLDAARVPARPARPNIPFNMAAAMILGLSLGLGLAFVMESLDHSIYYADEVPAVCGLVPLAVIPLAGGGNPNLLERYRRKSLPALAALDSAPVALIAHQRPKSDMAESYRALRTSILLSSADSAPKVIMATSALPQEGKTTTSVNMAVVLAQGGGRVLLVESDMRRPGLAAMLGLRHNGGLSELLAGITTEQQAIVPFPEVPNLDVLLGGTAPPNPTELLGSPTMRNHLAGWRQRYDHVVLDTPPMLTVTDAVLLSPETDAVLLVVRAGQTTYPALRRARELLALVNARVVGVVMNGVDVRAGGYYSYNYYHSGYGYSHSGEEQASGTVAR